jgi:hypothetical protein
MPKESLCSIKINNAQLSPPAEPKILEEFSNLATFLNQNSQL